MAQTQHTPGPWVAREGTSTGMEIIGKKPRGGDYVIARCGGKDREANARLIAAAPDMLEALRWAANVIRPGTDLRQAMDAAIAKAEGSTNA